MAWKWKVKVAQSGTTLCDPMDYTVHGILQTRILEWVAVPFSRGSSQPRDRTQISRIAGGFFTSWATREALHMAYLLWLSHSSWIMCSFPPSPLSLFLLCFLIWKFLWTFHKCRDSFFSSVQSNNESIEDTLFLLQCFWSPVILFGSFLEFLRFFVQLCPVY